MKLSNPPRLVLRGGCIRARTKRSFMNTIILFRASTIELAREMEVASTFFRVETQRSLCKDATIIGRYSTLPFYKELEQDLLSNGCRLINSHAQHIYIANFDWYNDVVEFTPKTYFSLKELIDSKNPGPYVIKGRTNSRKYQWSTHMFAPSIDAAYKITNELNHDMLLGSQELVYREYVPLVTYEIGLNEQRFTNEWRIFYLGEKRIAHGYYWSTAQEHIIDNAVITDEALKFADNIATIISRKTNFFVLDIAEKESGGWTLIEVNCGTMSGLSEIDTDTFYRSLLSHVS